jgi:hypothetical protein
MIGMLAFRSLFRVQRAWMTLDRADTTDNHVGLDVLYHFVCGVSSTNPFCLVDSFFDRRGVRRTMHHRALNRAPACSPWSIRSWYEFLDSQLSRQARKLIRFSLEEEI